MKGSRFERTICHQLDKWWTGRDDISCFWRTAGSGARATVRARKGKTTAQHAGDICAIDPIGKPLMDVFAIELKDGYSQSTFAPLLDRPDGRCKITGYEVWLGKAVVMQANAGSFAWLLIHRRPRREVLVYMPWVAAKLLVRVDRLERLCIPYVIYRSVVIRHKNKKWEPTTVDVFGMQWKHFLKQVTPKHIINLSEEI